MARAANWHSYWLLSLADPLDVEAVKTSLNSFSGYALAKQVRVDVITINNPQILYIGQNVQPATATLEYTAHPFSPTAAILVIQTHLAPQNARTFRT